MDTGRINAVQREFSAYKDYGENINSVKAYLLCKKLIRIKSNELDDVKGLRPFNKKIQLHAYENKVNAMNFSQLEKEAISVGIME